jgi:uncharacterized protein
MQCPTCTNVALVITERQSVEIDYCPQCRGVWLDRGELDKLMDRAAAAMPVSQASSQRDSAYDSRYAGARRPEKWLRLSEQQTPIYKWSPGGFTKVQSCPRRRRLRRTDAVVNSGRTTDFIFYAAFASVGMSKP